MPAFQAYRWMCTWNNPILHYKEIFADFLEKKIIRFATGQLERAPTTGTLHLQAYVEFEKKMTLAGLKKLLEKPDWKACNGAPDQCIAYVTKKETRDELSGDTVWRIGKPRKENQGTRNDLEAFKEILDEEGEEGAWDNAFGTMLKYFKGADKYLQRKQKQRTEMTLVEFHFGEPGTGKTSLVQEENPDAFWMPPGKWWDGYNGQETVVLDEFNGWMPYSLLCRLCDSTPLKVEVKGGHKDFAAKKLVIISNYHPETWYGLSQERPEDLKKKKTLNIEALLRRLNRDGGIFYHEKGEEVRHFSNLTDLGVYQEQKKFERFTS